MSGIDWLILFILVYQAVRGFRRGFVKLFFDIVALLGAFAFVFKYYKVMAVFLEQALAIQHPMSSILGVVLLWVGLMVFVFFAARLVDMLVRFSGLGLFNRMMGFFLGLGKACLYLVPFMFLLGVFNAPFIQRSVFFHWSHIYVHQWVQKLVLPYVQDRVSEVPFVSEVSLKGHGLE